MKQFNIWQDCGGAWRFLGTLHAPGKKAVKKGLEKLGVDFYRETHIGPWANPSSKRPVREEIIHGYPQQRTWTSVG
jgi:hypothetical protein